MRPQVRNASTCASYDRRRGWRSIVRAAAVTLLLASIVVITAFGAASASASTPSKMKRAAYDSPKLDPIAPALDVPTARAATDDDIPGVTIPASPFSDSVSSTTDLDDVFSIALTAGQTLTVALVGPSGSQFNIYLYAPGTASVKDPDTPYVAVAAGTSYPCSFSYAATQSGTYYLDVYAKTGAGSYSVAYSGGGGSDDDIPGVAIPSSPFTESLSYTSDYDDVFRIALTAGQTLTVALVGPSGSQFNIYLYAPGTASVKDPDTPYVAVAAGTSYPCSFSYAATQSGTYYLDVYAKTGAGSYSVAYSVSSPGGGEVGLFLAAEPLTVPYHGTVNLSAALREATSGSLLPNREVMWYAAQDDKITGSWIPQGTQTSSTGEYAKSFWIDRLTYFALHFEGDGQYSEGWSNWVKVMARAKITPPAVPSRVPVGPKITSWGTIKPLHTVAQNKASHTNVTVQRFSGGKWRTVIPKMFAQSYRNTSSATMYSVGLRYMVPGKWRMRAVHQDSDHATTTSSWRTFTAN
jgi:hypothetical protein